MGIENVVSRKSGEYAALYEPNEKHGQMKSRSSGPDEQHHTLHRQLMDWYHTEKDKQSVNRLQQQIDCDFYDSLQWSEEEARELIARGQMPAVYNQVAPMVDWVIGTERRTRVDWDVLPREEGDLEAAEIKTKLMKHISDVNRVPFVRSKAFTESVKSGVGWIETGVSSDPTRETVYVRNEDWRCIWWDSNATELDLSDARYIWREKWIDVDVACAMFPDKVQQLKKESVAYHQIPYELEDQYYLGQALTAESQEMYTGINRFMHTTNAATLGRRDRVKVMEFWYRKPEPCFVCHGPLFNGQVYDMKHPGMRKAVEQEIISVVNHVKMRVYVAFITRDCVLKAMPSPYAHNRFPFTPIWCFRRSRDNLPYGMIRRVRDPQESLNKRQSKALWHLSARQVIADDDAVRDWQELAEEVSRPDGIIRKKRNAELSINAGEQHAAAHIEFAQMDAMFIQKSAGVTDENMGRKTNATSGIAIEARQEQGAVVTTEVFDNLRLAIQLSGEVTMSLTEQYYTMPKIIRITGDHQAPEFIQINKPEIDENGNVTYLNDISASQADFIVSEQDFAGSLRRAMFESMMNLTQSAGVTPEIALRLLRMAFEYSDFPNKDEIVQELRRMTGEPDPTKRMNEEEMAAMQEQQQAQRQAQELAQQMQQLQNEDLAAKVQLTMAQAEKTRAEMSKLSEMEGGGQQNDQLAALQEQTAKVLAEIQKEKDAALQKLAIVEQQLANRAEEIRVRELEAIHNKEATIQAAKIQAEAQRDSETAKAAAETQRAAIQAESGRMIAALEKRLEQLAKETEESKRLAELKHEAQEKLNDVQMQLQESKLREVVQNPHNMEKILAGKPKPTEPPPPPPPPPVNITLNVPEGQKTRKRVEVEKDDKGFITGAVIIEETLKGVEIDRKRAKVIYDKNNHITGVQVDDSNDNGGRK